VVVGQRRVVAVRRMAGEEHQPAAGGRLVAAPARSPDAVAMLSGGS